LSAEVGLVQAQNSGLRDSLKRLKDHLIFGAQIPSWIDDMDNDVNTFKSGPRFAVQFRHEFAGFGAEESRSVH
jgi:hypothetical protein